MRSDKEIFQGNCEYRFVPGMEAVWVEPERRKISAAYLDQMFQGEVLESDLFLLRAVVFYGIATAEMIVDFLIYYRNFYGVEECSDLLQPHIAKRNSAVMGWRTEYEDAVKNVRRRLKKLADKSYLVAKSIDDGKSKSMPFSMLFLTTANTVTMARAYFWKISMFSTGLLQYDNFFSLMPPQRLMEHMHACRICVLGFSNHGSRAVMHHNREIVFGSRKDRYTPTMFTEIKSKECEYHIITEPMHFAVDRRIHTETEHLRNLECMIDIMGNIVSHYRYVKNKLNFTPVKRVRFLLAVENVEGMRRLVRMMEKDMGRLGNSVFFTTDAFIKEKGNLHQSVFMVKKDIDAETGKEYLSLVRPGAKTLIETHNEWVLDDPDMR